MVCLLRRNIGRCVSFLERSEVVCLLGRSIGKVGDGVSGL